MSIYYECRFKDLRLDLSSRPDIVKWLKQVKEGALDDLDLPDGMIEDSRCEYLDNSFTENLKKNIDITNVDDVLLDLCIGNKNKDDDIENLILLLKPYIKSGSIFFYNEDITKEVDIEKTVDKYLEFIDIEDSLTRHKESVAKDLEYVSAEDSLTRYKESIADYINHNDEYVGINEDDLSYYDESEDIDYLYELLYCGLEKEK